MSEIRMLIRRGIGYGSKEITKQKALTAKNRNQSISVPKTQDQKNWKLFLILGETETDKELIARAIYNYSPRRDQ